MEFILRGEAWDPYCYDAIGPDILKREFQAPSLSDAVSLARTQVEEWSKRYDDGFSVTLYQEVWQGKFIPNQPYIPAQKKVTAHIKESLIGGTK